MPDNTIVNEFNTGMNAANTAFGVPCAETFHLITGGSSTPLQALSIDEINEERQLSPGGIIRLGDVILYVLKTVWDGADIQDGAKLIIRGKRFRFNKPSNDGDNIYTITCGPTGPGKINA